MQNVATECQQNDHIDKETFFCEYDPQKEYGMEFITLPDGTVKPCCVPNKNPLLIKNKRERLLQQLHQMQKRIELSGNLFEEYFTKGTEFSFSSERIKQLNTKIADLSEITQAVQEKIQTCIQDNIYDESYTSLKNMPLKICEPLDKAVKTLQQAFFPRLFQIERWLGVARSKQAAKGSENRGWISGFLSKLYAGVISVLRQASSAVRITFNFLYTYGFQNFKKFMNIARENVKDLITFSCHVKTDEDVRNYYLYLHEYLKNNIIAGSKTYTLLNNAFKRFCDRREYQLLLYIVQTAESSSIFSDNNENKGEEESEEEEENEGEEEEEEEEEEKSEQEKEEREKRIVSTTDDAQSKLRKENLTKIIQTINNNVQAVFQNSCSILTNFDTMLCVDILWVICVYSLELLRGIFSYTRPFTCRGTKAPTINFEDENEEKSVQKKGVEEETPTWKPLTDDKLSMEMERLSLAHVQPLNIGSKETEKIGSKGTKNESKGTENMKPQIITGSKVRFTVAGAVVTFSDLTFLQNTSKIIDSAYIFFWVFTKANFVPKDDIELNNTFDEFKKQRKLAPKEKVLEEVRNIEKVVNKQSRNNFCTANGNTQEACNSLLESKEPMTALPNIGSRHKAYIEKTKFERKSADAEEKAKSHFVTPETADSFLSDVVASMPVQETSFQKELKAKVASMLEKYYQKGPQSQKQETTTSPSQTTLPQTKPSQITTSQTKPSTAITLTETPSTTSTSTSSTTTSLSSMLKPKIATKQKRSISALRKSFQA